MTFNDALMRVQAAVDDATIAGVFLPTRGQKEELRELATQAAQAAREEHACCQ